MAEYRSEFPWVKLHRPHAIAGSIERPRLLEKLDQVLQRPVALISAPAGFGKTTLVTQWLDRQSGLSLCMYKRDNND
jgi:LuxR family maltose regulon positive regulatory protein